eukprot:9649630-Alexandrium_andersonii.AAC.1
MVGWCWGEPMFPVSPGVTSQRRSGISSACCSTRPCLPSSAAVGAGSITRCQVPITSAWFCRRSMR